MRWRRHHLIGDAVCFLLVGIARLIHLQLRLQPFLGAILTLAAGDRVIAAGGALALQHATCR
jgi:hypothetical protein